MAIQIGTCDGLVNITKKNIICFVKAIDFFSKYCINIANEKRISFGSAFQNLVEPVYNENKENFEIAFIEKEAVTKSGKKHSPARVTYCKKMGLLRIDENEKIFELTPIGRELLEGNITVEEYAFIILSKQGIFKDGVFKENLLSLIAGWFEVNYIISEGKIKNFLVDKFNDNSIEKTRLDIILNALSTCGIVSSIGNGEFVLSNINSAEILKDYKINSKSITPSLKDNDPLYYEYMGSMKYGVFDILSRDNFNIYTIKYKAFKRYIVAESKLTKDGRYYNYATSLRTKPFLLLAGISGTGKSRIVKQMAFDTCPNIDDLQKDKTSPGNYQLIEVKPNWHDSTEVLGYESEIGVPHYVVTPFVKFLVKAMLYEDKVPFFVCMDEMNLAPVEQYFAEFLSVLESRKLIDGHITSEALIPADVFKEYEFKGLKAELSGHTEEKCNGYEDANLTEDKEKYGKFNILYDRLKKEGLRIPSNLIVVGTVNMDETTHQFSRKVIDRAMTIEMNIADGSKPFAEFFEKDADLKYRDEPLDKDLFVSKVVQAKEALELLATENASDVDYLKANIPALLSNLNDSLNGTPFKIAYRVQNELVIYFFELRRENKKATAETLLTQAMDAILMQKVLPRVEGDEDLLEKPLEKLHTFTQNYKDAHAKVEEMQARLNAHFTSFWP